MVDHYTSWWEFGTLHPVPATLASRPAAGGATTRSVPVIDLARALVVGPALLVLLHGAMLVLRYGFDISSGWGLVDAADLGNDAAVGTWWSAGVLALAGLVALGIGASTDRADRSDRSGWLAVAGLLVLLSVDEVATFHDDVSDPLAALVGAGGALTYVWVVPGMALIGAFVAWQWRFLTSLPTTLRRRLAVASAVYFAGAVGFEMVESLLFTWTDQPRNVLIALQIGVEELLEMAGAVLVLLILARHLAGTDRLPLSVGGATFQVELALPGRRDPLPSPPR